MYTFSTNFDHFLARIEILHNIIVILIIMKYYNYTIKTYYYIIKT